MIDPEDITVSSVRPSRPAPRASTEASAKVRQAAGDMAERIAALKPASLAIPIEFGDDEVTDPAELEMLDPQATEAEEAEFQRGLEQIKQAERDAITEWLSGK